MMRPGSLSRALLSGVLLVGLVACSPFATSPVSPSAVASPSDGAGDILTQTVLSPERLPVTVLVKYAFAINSFEKAAEAALPQLDLIQVGNYTADMGIAEYEARLRSGDLTDLVMTWPLEVGEPYWSERLLELSSLPLTSRYLTAMLNDVSREGKLYYLPGPSQLRAIVYNKTLFQENNWQLPTSFEEFVALCKTIEASGIRSLQLGLGNAEVLDTAFVGFGFAHSYSRPENALRIAEYDRGTGSFADNYLPALTNFKALIDAGILRKEDLTLHYQDREQMLFTRQCAMVEDSVLMARMGFDRTGCTDEFGLLPFWNPALDGGADSDWARLYPVCYIGVDKRLAQPENKAKYDLVMQLLEYISTPQGQEALAGDTGAMLSPLRGVPPPNVPEISALLHCLEQGRYARFPTLKNAQWALRQGLAGMVTGQLTADEVVALVDAQNAQPPAEVLSPRLGTATEDFSLLETGNYLTDAMRQQCGSDFALFLDNGKDGRYNGKGVSGKLYKGVLTQQDIRRILPDLKHQEKGELCKVTMTGQSLLDTLEYAIPVDNDKVGWFYYFSGLRMEYAPAATPGRRIRRITDTAGNPIDPKRVYSVAVSDGSVPVQFILSLERTGKTIYELLSTAITRDSTITPSGDGRFVICQP